MTKSKATNKHPTLYFIPPKMEVTDTKPDYCLHRESFVPTIEIEKDQEYFAVICEYSTGVTAGRYHELQYAAFDAYNSYSKALTAANAIHERNEAGYNDAKNIEKLKTQILLGDGSESPNDFPWEGHFEALERIIVKRFAFEDEPNITIINV